VDNRLRIELVRYFIDLTVVSDLAKLQWDKIKKEGMTHDVVFESFVMEGYAVAHLSDN
jgi:hypothetical protein